MNSKRHTAALWLALALPAAAQQAWTLDDCINYALENNIQVKQAQLQAESSAVDVKSSKAALFPTLTFSTSQQFGFQKVESQDVESFVTQAKNPTYTGSYSLQANVTLYNGGQNWRSVQQSRLQNEADRLSAQRTENSVEEQIIRAYYQILYAHESVLTDEAIVQVAQTELERTEALLEVGKGSKIDVAQMKSQLQQNEYQLVVARNQEAGYLLALKQLLQLETSADFAVDYQPLGTPDVLTPLPAVEDAQQQALTHLPDLRAAQLSVENADMQVKIAKGAYQPTLSLGAGITSSNGNTYTGNFAEQVEDHLRESIGLTLSLPIWDARRTRSSVEKAQIAKTNAQYALEDTRLQLQNTIADLHLDIQSAQSRYVAAVQKEAAAKESFELMDGRYGVGLETLIDLLSEKNTYLQAQQETLQAKYTALLNLRLMQFYTGQ